jgi:uncharacterized membrane protein YkvA (DUF1232 family)
MMSADKVRKITPPSQGVMTEILLRGKLILRLLGDKRVNLVLKLLPIGSLVYLISPIDFMPIPIPVDDALILWLGGFLFIELCPPDVVQEHMAALNQVIPGEWKDGSPSARPEEDVVDGEWHEK